jgi:hypothetical protein
MADDCPASATSTLTIAQVLMSMQAWCTGCWTIHDGYTPCPGETRTPAQKAGVRPLP